MAVVPEQSVLDLVVAYKHLSEEEQARFWALMDKQRAEFMFSSKSRRELMARAAAGPSVPHEVAERMKQVRPPVSFQGDIRESVCTYFPLEPSKVGVRASNFPTTDLLPVYDSLSFSSCSPRNLNFLVLRNYLQLMGCRWWFMQNFCLATMPGSRPIFVAVCLSDAIVGQSTPGLR